MPLTQDYFNKNRNLPSPYTARPRSSLYPTTQVGAEDDNFSLFDMLGSALWHGVSSATMGLTEFAIPTKPWEEKGTDERMGAAIGEALGMFLPMGLIGTGARGVAAGLKYGSKTVAKNLIKEGSKKAVKNVADEATSDAMELAIKKGMDDAVFSREGKRLLYNHELGGDIARSANNNLLKQVDVSIRAAAKKAGIELDDAAIKQIMDDFGTGLLKEGQHINSVSHWMTNKLKWMGDGRVGSYIAKYAGEVAQDAVILGMHGVMTNMLTSAARNDVEFAPGSSLGHALVLSAVFPLIRSIPGGGERSMREGWNILRANYKKTNYDKVAAGENGAEDMYGLLQILTGKNLFGKVKWKSRVGKGAEYHVDDLAHLNINDKSVLDDMVDIAKQIQESVSKVDMMKVWGKDFLVDTFMTPGTIARMALGAAVMNVDMFRHNMAGFKNLPPEELLTHMLIGAFMTRGRGGWKRDPNSRSGDEKAATIDKYFEFMNLVGIDHSSISDVIKIKNYKDLVIGAHHGLKFDPTAKEIERIFKRAEEKIGNRTEKKSEKIENDIIEEWVLLRNALGMTGDVEFQARDYDLLTPSERNTLRKDLSRVLFQNRPIGTETTAGGMPELKYIDYMSHFREGQAESLKQAHHEFLKKLGRPSRDGADDQILDIYIDDLGNIFHGGIGQGESGAVSELYNLLSVVNHRGKGNQQSQPQRQQFDFSDPNSPRSRRLDKEIKEFKAMLNRNGLGEGVQYAFNLGDIERNPYIRTWLQQDQITSQRRLGDIFVADKVISDTRDVNFRSAIEENLTDPVDRSAVSPEKIRIIDKNGNETTDYELASKLYGIAEALYNGNKRTKREPRDQEFIEIDESLAQKIVNSYEGLGVTIKPENLGSPEFLNFLDSRVWSFVRRENVETVRLLRDFGLAVHDKKNGKLILNSDEGIAKLAREQGLDPNEMIELHNEVKNLLPKQFYEIYDGGVLRPQRELIVLEELKTIVRTIPEIYNKEVKNQIFEAMYEKNITLKEKDIEAAEEMLHLLDNNLKAGEYDAALQILHNLRKYIPRESGVVEKLFDSITEAQLQQRPMEIANFEASKESGFGFDGLRNIIEGEQIASKKIETLLGMIIYKGETSKYSAINEHARLIDNLNKMLKNTVQETSLDTLLEKYLGNNSYESLLDLMRGVNQHYAGGSDYNLVNNRHLMDSYESFMQRFHGKLSKTKFSIADKYNLLDPDNKIKPEVIDYLKTGKVDKIIELIPADKRTDKMDQDLVYLSWIVNSSRERMALRFTEKLNEDGSRIDLVREWIQPHDNTEFNTPANMHLDNLTAKGIELYAIHKTGILNGRTFNDPVTQENIKIKFEGGEGRVFDRPEGRYLLETIKNNGELSLADMQAAGLILPEKGSTVEYIEVSFGRPLAFVANERSLKALDKAYNEFYKKTIARYKANINNNKMDQGTLDNFKAVFDPNFVKSNEIKIRALYLSSLNRTGFDKLWSREAMENMDIHGELSVKLLKYSKLAEGGSWKAIPNVNALESMIMAIATRPGSKLPKNQLESVQRIINDLNDPNKLLKAGMYADESSHPNNGLTVRNRIFNQIENDIQNQILKDYQKERVSDINRFKDTMDKSAIDGAIYIDKDLRNLFNLLLGEGGATNGYKGSIAKGGMNADYILYGKGLFIYDPVKANAMEKKGIRLLVGESAAKGIETLNILQSSIVPRTMRDNSLSKDIELLGDKNIFRLDLEGFGLRFHGHESHNSPVPHPYAHFASKNDVIAVRDGWMKIYEKIQEIKTISNNLKLNNGSDIYKAILQVKEQQGLPGEMNFQTFAESMLKFGFNTNNEVVREAVIKVFEDQTLPILFKPKNPKFAYPFLTPDLRSSNPISVDVTGKGHKGSVRIQLGESTIGSDSRNMPVHSIGELVFSIRIGEVDYMTRYNKQNKSFELYTPLEEFQNAGYEHTVIDKATGKPMELIKKGAQVPKGVKDFIIRLDEIISGKRKKDLSYYTNRKGVISHEGVQRIIEREYGNMKYNLSDNKFGMIAMVERGPRKGRGDFIPTRLRVRSRSEKDLGELGYLFGLNSYDARANAQADWDGDKVRYTFDFSNVKGNPAKFKFLKQSYREASIDEEYSIKSSQQREANIFGVNRSDIGTINHAGSKMSDSLYSLKRTVQSDQRAVGQVIGIQSAIQWMQAGGLKLFGRSIKDKVGFEIDHIMEFGDIYRRWIKGNQTVADFIQGVPEVLKKESVGYMFEGFGENKLKGSIFGFKRGSVEMDILAEIVTVLKRPSSIFNQVWSEAGAKNPNSYNLHSEYVRLRKFFSSPNSYIFRKLVNKYARGRDYQTNEKLNELIPLFFKTTKGMDIIARDIDGLKKLALEGRLVPRDNPIQFEVKDSKKAVEELINLSNAGHIMDQVVRSEIYRNKEIDLAWNFKGKKLSNHKKMAESFIDEITLYRALGIDFAEMTSNGARAFKVGRDKNNKYLISQENAGLMYDLLNTEKASLINKLEYQYGFGRGANTSIIENTNQRLIDVSIGMDIIQTMRTQKVIEAVSKSQQKYTRDFTKKAGYYKNNTKREVTIYTVDGALINKDGTVNFKAIKYYGTVGPGKSTRKLNQKIVILKNPIVAHRMSRERTLDGYTWHYLHRNVLPEDAFDVPTIRGYEKHASKVRYTLKNSWNDAINDFKNNRAFGNDIFNNAYIKKTVTLDEFFKSELAMEHDILVNPDRIKDGMSEKESLIYYKTLMLLRPDIIHRHVVSTDKFDLPYLALNKQIFKDVFSYLSERGYESVATEIAKDYNHISDYLSGRSNEMTFDLRPSSMYTKRYELPKDKQVDQQVLLQILGGIVTPDLEVKMRASGIGFYETDSMREMQGEFTINQVRNEFSKSVNQNIEKRKGRDETCR